MTSIKQTASEYFIYIDRNNMYSNIRIGIEIFPCFRSFIYNNI